MSPAPRAVGLAERLAPRTARSSLRRFGEEHPSLRAHTRARREWVEPTTYGSCAPNPTESAFNRFPHQPTRSLRTPLRDSTRETALTAPNPRKRPPTATERTGTNLQSMARSCKIALVPRRNRPKGGKYVSHPTPGGAHAWGVRLPGATLKRPSGEGWERGAVQPGCVPRGGRVRTGLGKPGLPPTCALFASVVSACSVVSS
jgi:hypothetical protein